jgi:phosphoglycerol geranylgeranyltransferase
MNRHSKNFIQLSKTDRKLGILIDPDKHSELDFAAFVGEILALKPDYILIGSSIIVKSNLEKAAQQIKSITDIPLILFPGHFNQLNNFVDGVMLLSLISGRNPDLLIGQHVLAAPILAKIDAEILSTGYMLIDGGKPTSVSYISNTLPIPQDKNDIAICTALAGQFIGMKYIYLDAGSGAINPVPFSMVSAVAESIELPLIVGGGIKDMKTIEQFWESGANLVVIGNALERNTLSTNSDFEKQTQI